MGETLDYHISSYDYHLPRELIAQAPVEKRVSSRLLVLGRDSGEIKHSRFSEISSFLRKGDLLVLNDTKVFRNRIYGRRVNTGGKVEVFLLTPPETPVVRVITRSGGRLAVGERIAFPENGIECRLVEIYEDGERLVEFNVPAERLREMLEKHAEVPLPPYIKREKGSLPEDVYNYQTVYASRDGAVAAPTAGFHFTEELLDALCAMGVKTVFLTLHVGRGTFEPVRTTDILKHKMHSEWFELTQSAADTINATRSGGGRVIPVGTTSVRVLETTADEDGVVTPRSGETDIFIYPPYRYRACDALVTNFHLPKSTLLMLVSAFSGRRNILRAYQEAVRQEYRFFSYGDAMFLY